MRIVMVTNTYLPHVGGVAHSVHSFAEQYRACGHDVVIVCPRFPGTAAPEPGVFRVPAMQHFNGSDFSVALPVPPSLREFLSHFEPEIIHSHHPFLLGGTALRLAAEYDAPLVFTHHTMYEQYTHYVPLDAPHLARFVVELSTRYANLCNAVISPSQSIATVLRERRVEAPITVIPTGVDRARFERGDRALFRRQMNIPQDAVVIGHMGRLAPEKNLDLLAGAAELLLTRLPSLFFLVVGDGPSRATLEERFASAGHRTRVRFAGMRRGQELVNSLHAMDRFVFTSHSETQGMVLLEAMATGLAVVALDAPGTRDVISAGVNGTLVYKQDAEAFADAVESSLVCGHFQRELVRASIEQFSMEQCAQQALSLYESLRGARHRFVDVDESAWWLIVRRIQTEWTLLSTVAGSLTKAVADTEYANTCSRYARRVVRSFGDIILRLRRRHRRQQRRAGDGARSLSAGPGLILVQIDGLSRKEFERALAKREMPFLRSLSSLEEYALSSFYSGLPTSTPAVQGELFYGVPTVVPAFSYFDRERSSIARMYETETAARVEAYLSEQGEGLLRGGSSYSNIFTGGAVESHFCASDTGWKKLLGAENPGAALSAIARHPSLTLRVLLLVGIELTVGFVELIRGITRHYNPFRELKFLASRTLISIVLREVISAGAADDAQRGLPVIHLNFLGFDEQAHRRGPSSAFAHWALRGIDRSIQRVWKASQRSHAREYGVWVYSDHGQEETEVYPLIHHRQLENAVRSAFGEETLVQASTSEREYGSGAQRAATWGIAERLGIFLAGGDRAAATHCDPSREVIIAALGPLGHVYLPPRLRERREELCRRLIQIAQIPLVLMPHAEGVAAFTAEGEHQLPRDFDRIVGADAPFSPEICQDLLRLARHRDCGDIVLSGWRPLGRPYSFPFEHGAHGGPGRFETEGFLLAPPYVHHPRGWIRPFELRERALNFLGRAVVDQPVDQNTVAQGQDSQRERLRMLTWNVNEARGWGGRPLLEKIAEFISAANPDLVALQAVPQMRNAVGELMRRVVVRQASSRSRQLLQHAVGDQFGNAVLSRYPLLVRRSERYSVQARRGRVCGVLEVSVRDFERELARLFVTRLSTARAVRNKQVEELVGPRWLLRCEQPTKGALSLPHTVLCGDLKAAPCSRVWRRLSGLLVDARSAYTSAEPVSVSQLWRRSLRERHFFIGAGFVIERVESVYDPMRGATLPYIPELVDVLIK